MHAANLGRYLFLLRTFRNGPALIRAYRRGLPAGEAVLWSGARLIHPPDRGGFVGTILEVWRDRVYTVGFYRPRDGDVVVDAGAHVGLFSLMVARENPRCRVVALEPFAENHACLEANVRTLGARNVEVYRKAVGSGSGVAAMRAVGTRSIDHVMGPADPNGDDAVEVVGLEGVLALAGVSKVALFKCDVEGSERDAFEAADPATLARFQRIALEYHDNLRPGTLRVLVERLHPTHEIVVRPEPGQEHGLLLARLRS